MSTNTITSRHTGGDHDDALSWFREARPQLRDDATLMGGLDDRPLLFIESTGRYVSLGSSVVPLLPCFDGTATGDELADRFAAQGEHDRELVADKLAKITHGLRQAGALTEEPAQLGGRAGVARFMRREHLLRLPLTRKIGDFLEPPVALLRKIPGKHLALVWSLLALVGLAIGGYAIATAGSQWQPPQYLWLLYPLMFTQIAFHELSHALVCQYLRAPVREAGVGLMLYVMPVGYVDRTDAYRVRDRKSRAFIALAGPVNDQLWFGVTGIIALTNQGTELGNFAFTYLIFQAFLTLMNFNPVSPSDGYHMVSALSGAINFRGQALSYLTHLVLRLPLTPELERIPTKRRRWFVAYAIACLAFFAVLALAVGRTVLTVIGALQ
ncbi:M50 family metallopeptidase [Gulosibacter sp. ACHW.36C]|uniref:M50 family metallopeptidase n=1 Tax=Gulosibacter sediminis TaxID=1729695 RepID=A0ABY4MX34_9MICO|nr:M50 family metallopeptidase [Gulosibacter sediminis]UQN14988.1 M50 family metallopeptidase [Gulosibacter sediminis]